MLYDQLQSEHYFWQYENYRGWQGHIPSILISLCCEHQLYDCDTEQEYSYNVMSNQRLALAESKT